ncbi:MAG: DUF1795 domain-containing protein [Clostridiales bacterium]|nr:DUF1795 domain-containing protein [Clostridiales bacterium]
MRKAAFALLALVLCLALAACSGDNVEVPKGYKLVSGDDVPYRFYAPTQWSVGTGTGNPMAYYSIDDRSMVIITTYVPEEGLDTIAGFWDYTEQKYKDIYGDYEFIEKSETTLGGRDALRCVFTATIGEGHYKVMQVITTYKNYFYVLTYTSLPENFDSHLDEVNGMIGVFEFR